MKISIARRYRVRWFNFELFLDSEGLYHFINFGWGDPLVHAWWAVQVWIYWGEGYDH